MEREQNYSEADVSWAHLKEEIPKIIGTSKEEDLLYSLRIEDTEIPANQLRNYGSTIHLTERTVGRETIIEGLGRFFEKACGYAEKHKAPYVLVQDLKIEEHRTYNIDGLTQLLIE